MNPQSMREAAFSDPGHLELGTLQRLAAAPDFKRSIPEGPLLLDGSGNGQAFLDTPEFKRWVQFIKLEQETDALIKAKMDQECAVHQAYQDRIDLLKKEAKIEKIPFNKKSESDFWSFIKSIPFIRKGSLFLDDDGNFQTTWDDNEENYLGLDFFGNDLIRFVIFKHRSEKKIARVVGRDNQQGIKEQIRAFDLNSLLQS